MRKTKGKEKQPSMAENFRKLARENKGTDQGELLGFLAFLLDAADRAGSEQLGRWWELLDERSPSAEEFWTMDAIRHFRAAIMSMGTAIYHEDREDVKEQRTLNRLMIEALENKKKAGVA